MLPLRIIINRARFGHIFMQSRLHQVQRLVRYKRCSLNLTWPIDNCLTTVLGAHARTNGSWEKYFKMILRFSSSQLMLMRTLHRLGIADIQEKMDPFKFQHTTLLHFLEHIGQEYNIFDSTSKLNHSITICCLTK